ncbi:fasciclin domain-containing protein [Nocardia arizonensis]|uniref:fasciclin domain-containing protein n=1 Tax=Nocardia arizonensis TaxID=1141647 RepID=UPI0006D018F2|nr:fasciclin domain-containing protein [Nocardia arizonensis]
MRYTQRSLLLVTAVAVAALGASACSDNSTSPATSSVVTTTSSAEASSPTATSGAGAAAPVGAGCTAYAQQVPTGPGSVEGMKTEPVSVAAANNPQLTTLVAAVSGKLNPQVNLVGTLDGGQFTVFAPVDAAFAKLDPATVDGLKTDSAALNKILTYHVVPGRLAPNAVVGEQTTVEGGKVTVTKSGDDYKVNDATVICGGLETANATVYLIDTVLTPPAS